MTSHGTTRAMSRRSDPPASCDERSAVAQVEPARPNLGQQESAEGGDAVPDGILL